MRAMPRLRICLGAGATKAEAPTKEASKTAANFMLLFRRRRGGCVDVLGGREGGREGCGEIGVMVEGREGRGGRRRLLLLFRVYLPLFHTQSLLACLCALCVYVYVQWLQSKQGGGHTHTCTHHDEHTTPRRPGRSMAAAATTTAAAAAAAAADATVVVRVMKQ